MENEHQLWFDIFGFNMTVLAALVIGLLGRFLPQGWSVLAAAVVITLYTPSAPKSNNSPQANPAVNQVHRS